MRVRQGYNLYHMRKTLLFTLLATTICTACHKKSSRQCPTDDYTYTFRNNSRVDTVSAPVWNAYPMLIANVVAGDKRVFTYQQEHTTCPEVQDGYFARILVFETDPHASHFEYNSDSLGAIKCYLRASCYGCSGAIVPTGGTIKGTRTDNNKWDVNVDLTFGASTILKFSAHFIPGQ